MTVKTETDWTQLSGDPSPGTFTGSTAWGGSAKTHLAAYTTTGYWTFTGLSTSSTYRVGVSIPTNGDTVRYRVYDGGYSGGSMIASETVTQSNSLEPHYNLQDPDERSIRFFEIYEGTFSNSEVAVWVSNSLVGGDNYVVIDAADISEPSTNVYDETPTGGAQLGGIATVVRHLIPSITGGALLSGGFAGATFTEIASGGVEGSGTSIDAIIFAPPVIGGSRAGGTATHTLFFTESISGGAQLGGSALEVFGINPEGGALLGGESAIVFDYQHTPFGGNRAGGAAEITSFFSIPVSGGVIVSGPVYPRKRTLSLEPVGVTLERFPLLVRIPEELADLVVIEEGNTIPHQIREIGDGYTVITLKVNLGPTPKELEIRY